MVFTVSLVPNRYSACALSEPDDVTHMSRHPEVVDISAQILSINGLLSPASLLPPQIELSQHWVSADDILDHVNADVNTLLMVSHPKLNFGIMFKKTRRLHRARSSMPPINLQGSETHQG